MVNADALLCYLILIKFTITIKTVGDYEIEFAIGMNIAIATSLKSKNP